MENIMIVKAKGKHIEVETNSLIDFSFNIAGKQIDYAITSLNVQKAIRSFIKGNDTTSPAHS
jgi:hypothetical protein